MDRITEITEPVFNALAQLQRRGAIDRAMAPVVHQQVCIGLEHGMRLGGKLGISQQDLDEIRYALAATVDETVLSQGGALREFWLTKILQLKYFGENVAGDMFFERLAQLRRDPTRAEALRVYYLCLMFGFRGKYRVRGGELELLDTIDAVRNELLRAKVIPVDAVLSPHGARPYESIADRKRNLLLSWIAISAAAASVLLYAWLRLTLVARADELVQRLAELTGS